jgi:hypothetical protein
VWELDEKPGTTLLRRRSADVASVFLFGYSTEQIATALRVHVALIEDAIRWEMKRREKRRARG